MEKFYEIRDYEQLAKLRKITDGKPYYVNLYIANNFISKGKVKFNWDKKLLN